MAASRTRRGKTKRVTLTIAEDSFVDQWLDIKSSKGFATDADVGTFLLLFYQANKHRDGQPNSRCAQCHGPLSLYCTTCQLAASQEYPALQVTPPSSGAVFSEQQSLPSPAQQKVLSQISLEQGLPVQLSPQGSSARQLAASQENPAIQVTPPSSDALFSEQRSLSQQEVLSQISFEQGLPVELSSQGSAQSMSSQRASHFGNSSPAEHQSELITEKLSSKGSPEQSVSSQHTSQCGVSSPAKHQSELITEKLSSKGSSQQASQFGISSPAKRQSELITENPGRMTGVNSDCEAPSILDFSDSEVRDAGDDMDAASLNKLEMDGQKSDSKKKGGPKPDDSVENSNESTTMENGWGTNAEKPLTVEEFMTGKYPIPKKVVSGEQLYSHYMCDRCHVVFTLKPLFDYHTANQACRAEDIDSGAPPTQSLETLRRVQKKMLKLCTCCNLLFVSQQLYDEHMKTHNSAELHTCQSCETVFSSEELLKRHVKIPNATKKPMCKKCDLVYTSKCQMDEHKQDGCPGKRPYSCGYCDARFRLRRERLDHRVLQHKLKCRKCVETFTTLAQRREHMASLHKQDKDVCLCPICGKQCSTELCLDVHLTTHSEERPYRCPECPYAGKRKNLLKFHIKKWHSTGKGKYQCEFCGSKFVSSKAFSTHLQFHTGKKFACSFCKGTFTSSASLKLHERRHTGFRPYACHICRLSFVNKGELNLHLRVHSDERPYKCQFCASKFKRVAYLRKHKRLHTGERPFRCTHCSQAFIDKTVLNNHRRKHHPDECDSYTVVST